MKNQMYMENALINLFKDNPNKKFAVQNVYFDFQKYYNLSDYQKDDDLKYPQARYKHEIRSFLARLVKKGIIKRLMRGYYIYSKKFD